MLEGDIKMKRNRQRAMYIIVSVMMLLVILIPCYTVCAETLVGTKVDDERVVKVAYFYMGDYYSEDDIESGKIVSYDADYLNKVSEYTNLKFEYVDCKTWSNALAMLDNHEVDIVGTVQQSDDRKLDYEFCDEHYGYTVGELTALPDKNIVYED